jgi:hypothetical protein
MPSSGGNPFRRDTVPETLTAILNDQPEPLGAEPGLPRTAARLLNRCLEKRPDDRPQSMLDMAFTLEALAADTHGAAGDGATDRPRAPGAGWVMGIGALILAHTLVLTAFVGWSARRASESTVIAALARADPLVLRAQQDRLDRLQLHARLVASLPQLNALFETDAPTIRDYLQGYQQRSPGAPLLVALEPGGYVIAQTDIEAASTPESGQAWLARLLPAGGTGIVSINGRLHHAAVAHAEAAGTIFGSIIAAAPIDDAFAHALRDATESETVLLDESGIAGASLRAGQVPWRSLEELRAAGGAPGTPLETALGSARYAAWEVPLSVEPPIAAVILASSDDATMAAGRMQAGMLAIGGAAVAVVLIAGAVALRRTRRLR